MYPTLLFFSAQSELTSAPITELANAVSPHFVNLCKDKYNNLNNINSVNILYFNARSLLPKIDNLKALCSAHSPDIICIVESWLDETILDPEISIQGYSIVRLDRTRHGGGALVYVKNLFIYSLLYLGTPAFDCIVLSLNCSCQNLASPDFTIALFYRPPSSSVSYLDNLFTVLCNINVSLFSNSVLLGDFIFVHNPYYFLNLCLLFLPLT